MTTPEAHHASQVQEVDGSFVAPFELSYPYDRTLGPVLSRFLGGLAERRIEGTRSADGRVHVPPLEFDPDTGAALGEWAEVAGTGTVVTWSWHDPSGSAEPAVLPRPFAWALVRLDGADSAMLHAVDAGSPDRITTGARVRVRWADERRGSITDIACFEVVE